MSVAVAQETPEQKAAAFVACSVAPHADAWDRAEEMPRGIIRALGEAGLLAEMNALSLGRIGEEIGRGSVSLLSLFTAHGMVCRAIARWGSEPLRREWSPRLSAGAALAAFAVTEPEIGSDAAGVRCQAMQTAAGWRLDGCKTWISGARLADVALVLARTEAGPATFLIETQAAGVAVRPIRGMLGFRAAMMGTIELDGCAGVLLARPGFGFSHVVSDALDFGRFCIAWGGTGLLGAIVDAAVAYAGRREQFGVPLIKHQLIQRMIAEMVTDHRAARLLCEAAAEARQARAPEAVMASNTAKYFSSRAAVRAAADAVQIHGAAGLGPDLPVQRYYRDAKAFELIEGSNEIQQMLIARDAHRRRTA